MKYTELFEEYVRLKNIIDNEQLVSAFIYDRLQIVTEQMREIRETIEKESK